MRRVKEIVAAKQVYASGYSGRKIRIALLDTGATAEHPDLKGRIIYFRDFVSERTDCYDNNGHGSHIAGILCGTGVSSKGIYSGMAPGAELIVLKVLDEDGNGEVKDVMKALAWIEQNWKKYNIRLLNFSVGFVPGALMKEQQVLLEKIDELWDLGVMVITAAGNNGPKCQSVTVPGISRKVVTVGASDDMSWNRDNKAGYSGRGPTRCCIVKPEILAPGTRINSVCHKTNGYIEKSGTSMAAPVVCGAMALAFEKSPELTPAALKLLLYKTVKHMPKQSYEKAWGLLQVDALMKSL